MKTVSVMGTDRLLICFPYTPLDVERVRTLVGRRWHPELRKEGKPWTADATPENLRQLVEWGFSADRSCFTAIQEPKKEKEIVPVKNVPGLKLPLMPFQQIGVGFLQQEGGRALIGDDMGLGKTVQALAWLQLDPAHHCPAVVVCPASLKGNWEAEVKKFTTLEPDVLSGSIPGVPNAFHRRGVVSIINYDVLGPWVDILLKTHHTVIIDECQFVKNSKAKRTKAVQKLCAGMKHVVALSGTPILNRPVEFFNTLNLIAPRTFNNFWTYAQRYCAPRNNGFGWDFTGASNTEELHKKLGRIMIRRLKSEVLKDLPEKTQTVLPLELNGALKSYTAVLEDIYGRWAEEDEPDPLADITRISQLRRAAVDAKMELVEEWVDTFLDSSPNDKLILAVIHHSTSDRLMERYKGKALLLDGRTPTAHRQDTVRWFAEKASHRLLITNIQVGGTGFNLTCAKTLAFIELPWTPGERAQMEDRIHRIGQDRGTSVYYLVAKKTLEENMVEMLTEKKKVLDAVLDGKTPTGEGTIQQALIKQLREAKRNR